MIRIINQHPIDLVRNLMLNRTSMGSRMLDCEKGKAMTSRDKFQAQLDRICRQEMKAADTPITGIEREESERSEAKEFWDAIRREGGEA